MQTKTMMRYHPLWGLLFKKTNKQKIANISKDVEKLVLLYTLVVCVVNGSTTMENGMESSQTIKNKTTYDPAIQFLSKCPKELKTGSWRDICTSVFIAADFTIAKRGNKPITTLAYKDKQKSVYTRSGILLSLKEKEILSCAEMCINLEDVMLSEIASHKRTHTVWFYLLEASKAVKFIKKKVEWLPGAGEKGRAVAV